MSDKVIPLISSNDPILKTELERFKFDDPPTDPVELAHTLAQSMLAHGGIGLAANQLGLPYRAFAIMGEQIIVCFNPLIVDSSTEMVYLEEGCLSYPGLYVKIKRPRRIKVRYTEPNGNTVTRIFEDMTARVFQHELDHLDGVVHISRANRIHREQAFKQPKKRNKA